MIPLNTSATQACRRPCPSRLRRLAPLLLAATAAFLSLLSPIHGIGGEEGRLPNVVLVITDDQGYGDLSCLGNPVLKTPNLDKLYGESVRLTDYHVAPTCSPTRAALLTGRWSNRTGVWHTIMGRSMLRENEVTMGQIFQDAGYATGMFGKWHLGDNYPYRPEDRGFAEVIRHGGGGVGQTPDYWDNAYFDGSYFYNGRIEPVEGFCTDVWFDYAQRYILAQKQAGKPFFAYISTNAPHGPMHAPESSSQPYQHLGVHVANFFGMIANIDDQVGQLRTMLDREGLTENTIFIFTTDNGTSSGAKVFNAGMRGQKGSQYDGGHRVPFFLHWPAGGLTGGRDVKPIAAHVDVLPTLIDLCGIPAPQNVRFDGRSLRPLLEGRTEDGLWPDRILVTDSQRVKDPIKWKQSAVMTSRWRLVNGTELYDIQADPGQQQNVAAEHPEVIARLRAFYEDWWAELEPTFQQATPIHLGHPAENPTTLTCHDWITSPVDSVAPGIRAAGDGRRRQHGLLERPGRRGRHLRNPSAALARRGRPRDPQRSGAGRRGARRTGFSHGTRQGVSGGSGDDPNRRGRVPGRRSRRRQRSRLPLAADRGYDHAERAVLRCGWRLDRRVLRVCREVLKCSNAHEFGYPHRLAPAENSATLGCISRNYRRI
jgi:arylsulfatase A-like enzyme